MSLLVGLSVNSVVGLSDSWAQGGQMPPAVVTTLTIKPETLILNHELPGRVAALRTANIRPQVGGIVEKRLFEQGMMVKEGQPLFQIYAEPFKAEVESAQAALDRAIAALDLANTQLDRSKQLRSTNSTSQQSYDSAEAEAKNAKASVAEARAVLKARQINLDFTTIRSPISGRIGAALISEGTLVSANQADAMAVIKQINQVYVDLRRPTSSLRELQQAAMDMASNDGSEPTIEIYDVNGILHEQKGTALFTDITVDESSGDVTMRVFVENPSHTLLPGMFVRAIVPRKTIENALLVPQQAIIRDAEGKATVVVVQDGKVANIKKVTLGELVDKRYIITDGIEAGESVVIRGQTRVTKDGSPVMATSADPQQQQ
ncbi:efflux RND transporter periplasmic adaptor subunit [uncultured Cohaesibacter sp.]|uniref:efflux RND transporter periplasmic adaptor subunit n=1 Tax=uncultured Cohaesibacter sp. TaxID=1002546 RepID=UPI0029C789C7|nr:efflux RND transporter periplasmic adaptor subunit [uncultured Cohaesibacter sp.]